MLLVLNEGFSLTLPSSTAKNDRYCTFDNIPRESTFLAMQCPDSRGEDLSKCHCTIGIGEPEEAPNTDTCDQCAFCSDGTLAYDCRNVAEGTCIGRKCNGDCISSTEAPVDILSEAWTPELSSTLTAATLLAAFALR